MRLLMKWELIILNLEFIQWPLVKINFTILKVSDFSSNAKLKYGKQYPHERWGTCVYLLCFIYLISYCIIFCYKNAHSGIKHIKKFIFHIEFIISCVYISTYMHPFYICVCIYAYSSNLCTKYLQRNSTT